MIKLWDDKLYTVRSPKGRNYEIMTKPLPGKDDEQHHEICQHIVYVLALCYKSKHVAPGDGKCGNMRNRLKEICGITIDPQKGV